MKKKNIKMKYEEGGTAAGLLEMAPGILDNLISLLENNNAYSKQPTLNASTMRGMVSPYAFGGDVDEMDDAQLEALQQMADDNGLTLEELLEQIQSQNVEEEEQQMPEDDTEEEVDDSEEEFASGGKVKSRNGKNPFRKNKSNIPYNTKEWNKRYAKGGTVPIEVEGDEILQTPNGDMSKMVGPSHEEGGIDVSVPPGTKIFSDRLKVDDKTMQERKASRERRVNKIKKLLDKNPTDTLLKNSLNRTVEVNKMEEDADMQIQETVNAIANGEFAMGGTVKERKYAFGGEPPLFKPKNKRYDLAGNYILNNSMYDFMPPEDNTPSLWHPEEEFNDGLSPDNPTSPTPTGTGAKSPLVATTDDNENTLGAGDYVGLLGNAFNAIAPIINTNNAAKATVPVINRFRGFGRNALLDNDKAQSYVDRTRANKLSSIETATNSSKMRNRNSAMGVNTVRALDIATDMNRDNATNSANDSFSNEMIGILGQRSALDNQKDQVEMTGQTNADNANAQDRDNYYTNMAQNLTNFGTNVQGIGKSLNVNKSNKVNRTLLSQLSKYGLSFDKNGKLITVKK